jgi:hypothetical protein
LPCFAPLDKKKILAVKSALLFFDIEGFEMEVVIADGHAVSMGQFKLGQDRCGFSFFFFFSFFFALSAAHI